MRRLSFRPPSDPVLIAKVRVSRASETLDDPIIYDGAFTFPYDRSPLRRNSV